MKVEIETASVLVSGIRDSRCERGVCSALEAIHGIHRVTPMPGGSTLVVRFDPTRVVPHQMRIAVRVMGCRVESILLGGDRDLELAVEALSPLDQAVPATIGVH